MFQFQNFGTETFFPGTKEKHRERNFFPGTKQRLRKRNFLSGKTRTVPTAGSWQTFQFQNFGTETFSMVGFHHVKPFSSKILELKLLNGWVSSCQTFQFQNYGTETFSMVGFHHVKPFSSKISELKLSQWLDLIMSNLSVTLGPFKNFYFRNFGTVLFWEQNWIEFQYSGAIRLERQFECL